MQKIAKYVFFVHLKKFFLESLTHCESSDSFPDEDDDVPGGSFNWI